MNGESEDYVVDASVGIKLFVTEEYSDKVADLFARLANDPPLRLAVPDLFYIECANILWKHVRRFGYPSDKAQQDISALSELALASYPTSTLAVDALEIALSQGVTAYDACYVALSQHLDVSLITADEKLANALTQSSFRVLWLGALELPAEG